ncbi:DUF2273 domain-containing protein [Peptoniphilus sp.]|jgi:uncharacterized membrane protein|uniref:DUF2273 domain-containing protein n=1 Tax=Peptoniphilus sp. TaxID=1971214 RepID=UPI003D8DAE53
MLNNYGGFPDYQDNYENPNDEKSNEKIVVIEKEREKDKEVSIFRNKFDNFTKLHWNEFKYTLVALVIAILLLSIGFFRTLLIVILYLIGNLYGRYKDGDPRTLFMLERFFKRY